MENVLKITGKRQLKALFYFIVGIVVYICVGIYFKFEEGFFVIFIPMFIFLLFPTLFLHIEYLLKNRSEEYELTGDRIIQRKESREMAYHKDDIKEIIVYASVNYLNNGFYLTGFENYHYAKVILNSGECLYLTSLLAPGGIDKALSAYLKEIPYRRKKRLFCTTLY